MKISKAILIKLKYYYVTRLNKQNKTPGRPVSRPYPHFAWAPRLTTDRLSFAIILLR